MLKIDEYSFHLNLIGAYLRNIKALAHGEQVFGYALQTGRMVKEI
ncbi:hypothetical protein [Pedobacter sp. KLB.chiD]